MKKPILTVLAAVLILGGIAVSGCPGGTTPAGGEFNWDDMPLYQGASQLAEADWEMPLQVLGWVEGADLARIEWRYYRLDETATNESMVAMFYENEMPRNGWEELAWIVQYDYMFGVFNKNNAQDFAIIWISLEDEHTIFALMRASK